MPSKTFKVKSQLFQTIQLRWSFPFRKISVHADDLVIGSNLKSGDLQKGHEWHLQDGTKLRIKHLGSWPQFKIEIHINGHEIVQPDRKSMNGLFGVFL